MLIRRFKPPGSQNFGDALNDYLWPKLLNPKFAEIPGYFYGIGTLLGAEMPTDARITVFGAGMGYHGIPPNVEWPRWLVYFVRGPQTGEAMHSPYITDPGLLVHHFHRPAETRRGSCAFMPRWDNMTPDLAARCDEAGISLIDPTAPVEEVISRIRHTRLLLTEALHGAVVADTLRTPWVSIYADRGHEFKWYDWCGSMDMIWNPIDAATFSLAWARDNATPQLSALSTLRTRMTAMDEMLARFNLDIENYIG